MPTKENIRKAIFKVAQSLVNNNRQLLLGILLLAGSVSLLLGGVAILVAIILIFIGLDLLSSMFFAFLLVGISGIFLGFRYINKNFKN